MRSGFFGVVAALSGFFGVLQTSALDWQIVYTNSYYTFDAVACSIDGTKIVMSVPGLSVPEGPPLLISTNSGMTWISNSLPFVSSSVVWSADGSKLITSSPGDIWMSEDYGTTWSSKSVPTTNGFSMGLSASAETIVISTSPGWVYSSQDGGTSWTTNFLPSTDGFSLACSAGGRTMYSGANPGGLYLSTNAGVGWQMTSAPSNLWWSTITCSADGMKVFAGNIASISEGQIQVYTSTNCGESWSPTHVTDAPQDCIQLVCSADGNKVVALVESAAMPVFGPSPEMYFSIDTGNSWTTITNGASVSGWTSVGMTADGYEIVGGAYNYFGEGGGIYVSKSAHQPMLNISSTVTGSSFAWTIPSMNFQLQESSNLGATNWADVPGQTSMVLSNLSYQLTVPSTGNQSFFRLKSY